MTDEEALQKIIEKAERNGFLLGAKQCYPVITKEGKYETSTVGSSKFFMGAPPYYLMIIFRHDFNKAFWGEYWRPRLQTLVLEESPIQYMARYL